MTYRAEFDPYGKLLYEWSATPNLNTKKFTGYERDAGSGLDYAQARMYSSEWGRFLSPDPKGLAAANQNSPMTLNRYSYTNGNPVNFVDPDGTDSRAFRSTSSRTFDTWRGWTGPIGGSFGYNNAFGNFFGTTAADFAIDYSSIIGDIAESLARQYALKFPPVLIATTIYESPKKTKGCGDVEHIANWMVFAIGQFVSNFTGAVIQHTSYSFSITMGGSTEDRSPQDFIEAWRLNNGIWQDNGGNDDFAFPSMPFGSKGSFNVTAYAKFIEGTKIIEEVSGWGVVPESGLHSKYVPSFGGVTVNGEKWSDIGGLKREWGLTWDCTNGKIETTIN